MTEKADAVLNADTLIPARGPGRARHLEQEATRTVKSLIDALLAVDTLLKTAGRLLDRAQPTVSGKIILRFGYRGRVVKGDEKAYDVEPYLASLHSKGQKIRLIPAKNLVGRRPKFITDAGKRIPLYNDAQIILVLKEIERLFTYRRALRESIGRLRMAAAPRLNGVSERITQTRARLNRIAEQLAKKSG